jgi:hypothetical protein
VAKVAGEKGTYLIVFGCFKDSMSKGDILKYRAERVVSADRGRHNRLPSDSITPGGSGG